MIKKYNVGMMQVFRIMKSIIKAYHLFSHRKPIILFLLTFISCKVDDPVLNLSGTEYPDNVGKLLLTKCAVSGCHNNISKAAASGLSLETWKNMFEGGRNGAIVIPYRPDFSTLCFYTNTRPALGITLTPTMPIGQSSLNKNEYLMLYEWIKKGAPDRDGNSRFHETSKRKKIYITNMLCDVVTVFDTETLLAMNYVDVGKSNSNEFPVMVKVSPDGNYWYVVFLAAGVMQKFSSIDDKYIGEVNLGQGVWTTFEITPDSQKAFCVDNSSPGKIAYVDLFSLEVITTYTYGNNFIYPRGIVMNKTGTVLYLGTQSGNFIYKINVEDPFQPVVQEKVIDGTQNTLYNSSLNAYQIVLSPNEDKYFVSCEGSSEIKVIKTSNDSLLNSIEIGTIPQFMTVYKSGNKILVSCPYDMLSFPGVKGSVAVIDCQSGNLLKKINTGVQPYGIGIDESERIACVANGNTGAGETVAHHATNCGGNNGYVTFIDLNSMELIPGKKTEVAVYPFFVAAKN